MFGWVTRLFGKPRQPESEWQQTWDARKAALEAVLGPADDHVLTSMIPIYMGGRSDVLTFRRGIPGVAYVTAGLTCGSGQPPSSLGGYELMMCTREPLEEVAGLISGLSSYTLTTVIEPGDTIDLGDEQPPDITARALLAMEPPMVNGRFELLGGKCGLLLLVAITRAELKEYREGSADHVRAALGKSVLPYTDLHRQSVI